MLCSGFVLLGEFASWLGLDPTVSSIFKVSVGSTADCRVCHSCFGVVAEVVSLAFPGFWIGVAGGDLFNDGTMCWLCCSSDEGNNCAVGVGMTAGHSVPP